MIDKNEVLIGFLCGACDGIVGKYHDKCPHCGVELTPAEDAEEFAKRTIDIESDENLISLIEEYRKLYGGEGNIFYTIRLPKPDGDINSLDYL